MSIFIENEVDAKFDFDYKNVIEQVVNGATAYVNCPFEVSVEVTITDNETIKEINNQQRGIDNPTDVLSFPMVDYIEPGNFDFLEGTDDDMDYEYFEPDTGELVLGDIVLSVDKIYSQAEEFGHSTKRELAFLVAHSMLHLFGYDHMEDEERMEMERMQREILDKLGITRD
ncbi:MAG: rRNA maturation RNase YbeY [Lachnospiraceae bacterium]|nr:rRNA maturation RNase YbeY [Lachnospiraceae bacterium]